MKSARFRTLSSLLKEKGFIRLENLRKEARPSDREPFSAFGPSSVDNLAPPGRAHPDQKTVGPGPLQVAGLKCSFHNYHTPQFKNKLNLNHRLDLKSSFI
jgi:hypothetical protein